LGHSAAGLNPDEVVAWAPAGQADISEGGVKDMLLLDVTRWSLGIENGGVSQNYSANSTFRERAGNVYNGVENQTGIGYPLSSRERDGKDCRSCAISVESAAGSAGLARIEVNIDRRTASAVSAATANRRQHRLRSASYGRMTRVERISKNRLNTRAGFFRAELMRRVRVTVSPRLRSRLVCAPRFNCRSEKSCRVFNRFSRILRPRRHPP